VLDELTLMDDKLNSIKPGRQFITNTDTTLVGGFSATFSEVLFSSHTNHIRSYGPGLSSTFSSRGSSSSQVNLYWNGLPLNSPGLGSTDISLLPSNGFTLDQLVGGGSSLYGSQAMGAAVSVNTTGLKKEQHLKIEGGLGSFETYFGKVVGQFGGTHWNNTLSVQYQKAKNNFDYTYRGDTYQRENSDVELLTLTDDFRFKLSNTVLLTAGFWATLAERGSPASNVPTATNMSRLSDENFKVYAAARINVKKGWVNVTQGFLTENQRFWNNDNIDDVNKTKSLVSKVSYTVSPKNKSLKYFVGLENIWMEASGGNKTNATQNNLAAFASVNYSSAKFSGLFSLRQELIDQVLAPFSPNLGLEYQFVPKLSLVGNVSYNFRYPSLNDKYWTLGGNPDLLAEQGWNTEAGLKFENETFTLRGVYYHQWASNFIEWVPITGAVWSPQNIKKVEMYGLDISAQAKYKVRKLTTGVNAGYLYNSTTTIESELANDESVGKQLRYTPEHKMTASFFVHRKGFNFLLSTNYTGETFSRADNEPLSTVEAFNIYNAQVDYSFLVNTSAVKIFVAVMNFTNQEYQTLKNFPLPGIQFKTGLSLTI
jgi:iron complex outermembrane receptor protein